MTPRERFIAALELKPPTPGRVPHYEQVFFPTMEAFGRVHPLHRQYSQWDQMEERERDLHRKDIADLYVQIAERYEHDAIFIHPAYGVKSQEDVFRILDHIRELSGDKYFLMMHGDPTFAIPNGDGLLEFTYRLADEPDKLKEQANAKVERAIERAAAFREHGALDGFSMCSDYCFNDNPFMSPAQFAEFITPYLKRTIAAYRELGLYAIKHTDGNIMPILDQLVECRPHALHSLDPQGGVDIAEVKRLVGDQVCLIGNVSCSLMDSGTDEEVVESARYALKHGMPGGGYVFATSNCVYPGMKLARYELIHQVWREEGIFKPKRRRDSCRRI